MVVYKVNPRNIVTICQSYYFSGPGGDPLPWTFQAAFDVGFREEYVFITKLQAQGYFGRDNSGGPNPALYPIPVFAGFGNFLVPNASVFDVYTPPNFSSAPVAPYTNGFSIIANDRQRWDGWLRVNTKLSSGAQWTLFGGIVDYDYQDPNLLQDDAGMTVTLEFWVGSQADFDKL